MQKIEKIIKTDLNPKQQQVVTCVNGPVLVLAGAGSGKTRSIIYRTAYLISDMQVSPYNILIVTFTNKAAKELQNRLYQTFGLNTMQMWVGTFHGICRRILQQESSFLPFDENFSIYDTSDQLATLKKVYQKLDIDAKGFPVKKVHSIISRVKNSLITPDTFFDFQPENIYTKNVHEIYTWYQKELLSNNALDFDDLLLYTANLLANNPEVCQKYGNQFKYIMIDEYQDTNMAQFSIVNYLAKQSKNLCVVGDDDQAIYSWRGADIRNILNFENDYKNPFIIRLEQNYRSSQNILELANSLIAKNSNRHPKKLWTSIESNFMPELKVLESETYEAISVIEKIKKHKLDYNETVVLYRTNAQSRVFEREFMSKGIPYRIIGGVNFYQRAEIKDITAYLRILTNPNDNQSFLRIINEPKRGLGKVSVTRLINLAMANSTNLVGALLDCEKHINFGAQAKKSLKAFARMVENWQNMLNSHNAYEIVVKVINDLHLIERLENSHDPQEISKSENIKEFIIAASEFTQQYENEFNTSASLGDFLQNLSLQTDLDSSNDEENCVKLMTIHNAKGLEFDNVFLAGLEDGLLPHMMSIDSETAIEEERRLAYVAITRARKKLWLSYAKFRKSWEGNKATMPSRFLKEINPDFLHIEKNDFYAATAPSASIIKKPKKKIFDENTIHKGSFVKHKNYGNGVVLAIDGKGENALLTISFKSGMLKKIMASYIELVK